MINDLLILTLGLLTWSARATGPEGIALPGRAKGRAIAGALSNRLPEVAKAYGLRTEDLIEAINSDEEIWVDKAGSLIWWLHPSTDNAAPNPARGKGRGRGHHHHHHHHRKLLSDDAMALDDNVMDHESRTLLAQAAYTRDQAFQLHSKPGSSKSIADPQVSRWTRNYLNQDVSSITCAPYDIDRNSNNFGNAELDRILEIWKAVAEDFAPWDVDVTTQIQNQCACGGIAYLQCFADTADLPIFVFNTGIDGASEAASHEVGHALGLSHDGSASSSYYGGHGSGDNSWGPIMGASYGVSISQWSKGEYSGATNTQDDLSVISGYLNLRTGDHGSTLASATLLPPDSTGSVSVATTGIISTTGEKDYFRVNHGGGLVSVALTGISYKSNLNAAVNLLDSNGNVLLESNPNNSPKAGAVILSSNQPAGSYYISVSGHGVLDPSSGYTDYASLGQYWMDVHFISASACNNNGVCDGEESNANCAKDCPCNLNAVVTAEFSTATFVNELWVFCKGKRPQHIWMYVRGFAPYL
eukprot:gene3017-13039_t